jgi:hypothetical protein
MKVALYLQCLICVVLCLTNCGVPGIPKPPSLNLPQPVTDFRASRKGNKVYMAWTVPNETTDGAKLRKLGNTQICRGSDAASRECTTPVGSVPAPTSAGELHGGKPARSNQITASYTDQLPPPLLSENPAAKIFYAVSALNLNGRAAGLSNRVEIPAVIALPPPSDFHPALTATGIVLSWSGGPHPAETPQLRHLYRVYRRQIGTKVDTVVGETPFDTAPSYSLVDRNFEWEKTYDYRATVVQVIHVDEQPEMQFEGDDTPAERIFAHDIFPPAVPSGLQAASSGPGQQPFIDLIWTPDTDTDLAGYNVYRREPETPEQKINSELIKTPAFRDSNVLPGHVYFYSVSALDVRGNESAHSAQATETLP